MLIIPIGRYCGIVNQLNRLKIRQEAYPFDWMTSNLYLISDCISNNFAPYFDVRPVIINTTAQFPTFVFNKYGEDGFPHHNLDNPTIKDQLMRRIDRWNKTLQSAVEITFVHETFILDMKAIQLFITTLNKTYPNLKFHIIVIHEFADELICDINSEYHELSLKTDKYSIYKIHLQYLRQAMVKISNRFYDDILGNYKPKQDELKELTPISGF